MTALATQIADPAMVESALLLQQLQWQQMRQLQQQQQLALLAQAQAAVFAQHCSVMQQRQQQQPLHIHIPRAPAPQKRPVLPVMPVLPDEDTDALPPVLEDGDDDVEAPEQAGVPAPAHIPGSPHRRVPSSPPCSSPAGLSGSEAQFPALADDVSDARDPWPAQQCAAVSHRHGRSGKYLISAGADIDAGAVVWVDGDQGRDLGRVEAVEPYRAVAGKQPLHVLRCATKEETAAWMSESLSQEEAAAAATAQKIIDRHGIGIKVKFADFQADRKKVTFYYSSRDPSPKVRAALQECYTTWKCRVWFARCPKTRRGAAKQ